MMRIKSFTLGVEKRIVYEQPASVGVIETLQLKIEDLFRAEMRKAYKEVKAFIIEKFPILGMDKNTVVNVMGMTIKYDNEISYDYIDTVKFSLEMMNEFGNSCKLSTEWMTVPPNKIDVIHNIINEIILFVKGERAQGRLFDDDMRETVERDTNDDLKATVVFHGNDADKQGVVQ